MSSSKKRIAAFLFILMLVAFVAGCFNVQDSYALDLNSNSQLSGDISKRGLYHSSVYNGYTVRYGIDVSSYQGNIDWNRVAASGIEFAFIRVGVRGWSNGLSEDYMAVTNILGALNAGLKIGVYVYSQAINTTEAIEEADLALSVLRKCGVGPGSLALPITIDVEYGDGYVGRLYAAHLNKTQRTQVTLAFLDRVASAGYQGCIYSGKYLFAEHDMTQIVGRYHVWIAYWAQTCGYYGYYTFWQYGLGYVDGVSGGVDVDVWYDYNSTPAVQTQPATTAPAEDTTDTAKTDETTVAAVTDSGSDGKSRASESTTKKADDSSKAAITGKKDTSTSKTTTQLTTVQTKPSGWHYVGNQLHYADPSTGRDLTGVQRIAGNFYYFSETGAMLTGWQKIGEHKYYFTDQGYMAFGWRFIDGNWFVLDGYSGALISDTWIDGYYIGSVGIREGYYKEIKTVYDNVQSVKVSPEHLVMDVPVVENGVEYNLYTDCYMR